jgi:hypothetical protein
MALGSQSFARRRAVQELMLSHDDNPAEFAASETIVYCVLIQGFGR